MVTPSLTCRFKISPGIVVQFDKATGEILFYTADLVVAKQLSDDIVAMVTELQNKTADLKTKLGL